MIQGKAKILAGVLAGLIGLMTGSCLPARAADVEENYSFSKVAMPELMLGLGTRATAMGGAGTAFSDDLSSLHWNPAGLNAIDHMQVEFCHNSWIQEVAHEFLAFGMPFYGGVGAVGINYLGLGSIEKTGMTPDGQLVREGGQIGLSMFNLDAGYGFKAGSDLQVGGNVTFSLESLGERSLTALSLNAGGQYRLQDENIVLAAVLQNLGSSVMGYALPACLRAGAGYGQELMPEHELKGTAEFELPLVAMDHGVLHFGVEYGYAKMVFVRLGMALAQNPAQSSAQGITAGLGFTRSGWTLGYAFTPMGELGSAHRLSLGMDLEALSQAAAAKPAKSKSSRKGPALSKMAFGVATGEETSIHQKPSNQTMNEDEQAMRQLLQQSLNVAVEMRKAKPGAPEDWDIAFNIQRFSGPKLAKWQLAILTPDGKAVAILNGKGAPQIILWNTLDKNGKPYKNISSLEYQLVLTDVSNQQEVAKGPLFKETVSAATEEEAAPGEIDETFGGILFDPGRAEIAGTAAEKISRAAEFIKQHPRTKVVIEGFADPVDEPDEPNLLAQSRAEAVSRYLSAYHQISISRILIRVGKDRKAGGKSKDPRERALNRRVEIKVRGPK